MDSDTLKAKPLVINYRYRNGDLEILHSTCVPQAMQEAVDYSNFITQCYGEEVEYIEYREPGSSEWESLEWDEFDPEAQTWQRFQPRLVRAMGQG